MPKPTKAERARKKRMLARGKKANSPKTSIARRRQLKRINAGIMVDNMKGPQTGPGRLRPKIPNQGKRLASRASRDVGRGFLKARRKKK